MNWTYKRHRQNKANSRTDSSGQGAAGLPVPPVGSSVRNKANLPAPTGKVAGWQDRKR